MSNLSQSLPCLIYVLTHVFLSTCAFSSSTEENKVLTTPHLRSEHACTGVCVCTPVFLHVHASVAVFVCAGVIFQSSFAGRAFLTVAAHLLLTSVSIPFSLKTVNI